MTNPIYERLSGVRWRQKLQTALRASTGGLLIGAACAAVLGAWRWWQSSSLSPWWGVGAICGGVALGWIVGCLRRQTWQEAARAVDSHYQLKDRSATALAFLTHANDSPWRHLQVDDALQHLTKVDARQVVPWQTPRL